MSNYGLACMILDRVIEGFFYESDTTSSDYDNSYSDDRTRTGSDDRTRTGDGKGVLPVTDDKGKLISCDTRGKEGLEDLSQIKILKQVGGSDISFKYGDQVFGWNSRAETLGKGGFGEVKSFTLSDGKNVAIKKYPTWKFKKERKIIEDIEELDNDYNEGIILKNIKQNCITDEEQCINKLCDIVPAHYIQEEGQDDQAKFLINTWLPDGQYSDNFKQKYPLGEWPKPMEYSFIAMEAMTGSLKKYSRYLRTKWERVSKEAKKAKEEKEKSEAEGIRYRFKPAPFYVAAAAQKMNEVKSILDDIFVNVTKIILKVAKILKCLSDKGYYYPDLKSDNVLYKCDGENIIIKLGDIGSLTTERNLKRGHYLRTYYDSQGNKNKSTNYTKWESNLKYYHVHLLGYLYIEILSDIFDINFGDKRLKEYTKAKFNEPNDEQIRKDIGDFMYEISTKISKMEPEYSFYDSYDAVNCERDEEKSCIGEHFSELINNVLHKTIVSQLELSEEGQGDIEPWLRPPETELKHSFRYNDESELIRVLESIFDKINMDGEG